MSDNPLGKPTGYPDRYAPELLHAVPRAEARQALGIAAELPFGGADLWNAWELTWLDPRGKPVVATAAITVPADSANIVESKSLKLYLNSFSMMRHGGKGEVGEILDGDLSRIAGADVAVDITTAAEHAGSRIIDLPGECIDYLDIDVDVTHSDAALLRQSGQGTVEEELHSHLLRSLCLVTGQPDMGSVLVRYRGPQIERESLLRYIVSYRQHQDFHEACVERMFIDIRDRCQPELLTVYARFNRRGGLDINPFRSDFESAPAKLRLWRQ